MDPATMAMLASIAGSAINAYAQSSNNPTPRVPYTGDAAPQGTLANTMKLLKALMPGLVDRAQSGPDIHDDVLGQMPAIDARHFPTSMSLPTAGHESLMKPYAPMTPQRKSITQIPGLDTNWTGSSSRSFDGSTTAAPVGTAIPRPGTEPSTVHANPTAPTRNTVSGLPGEAQYMDNGGTGIDDRTRGALMLLQHAATMAPPQGRRAA